MRRLVILLAVLFVLAAPVQVRAEPQARQLGTHRNWTSYSYDESAGSKVCFIAAKPAKSLPAGARRGDIYAMITHRPAQNSKSVLSIVAGYTYKANSEVEVAIGNQKFSLFTDGDTAWARDEASDRAIVQAIRSGSTMTVTGTSARGTKTTDTYSLAGSSAALEAINKACGVN